MKKLFLFLAVIVALCSGITGDISALEEIPFPGVSKAYAFLHGENGTV